MGSFVPHGSSYSGDGPVYRKINGFGMLQPWEEEAACRDTPLELWFGTENEERGKRPFRTKEQSEQAKAICASCPVLAECRRWALDSRIPYGFVGGLSEAERRRLWVGGAQSTCAWCETTFTLKNAAQRFCSQDCYRAAKQSNRPKPGKPEPRMCKHCGEQFTPKYKSSAARHCSNACAKQAWKQKAVTKPQPKQQPRQKPPQKTHCKRGHLFDEENTLITQGHRVCRTCNRIRWRNYKERATRQAG